MLDFGFGELLLLGVIALVVLGPERLPVAARLLGRWLRTARSQWNAVKAELENEIADEELRRNLREAAAAMRAGVQPLADAQAHLAGADGQMRRLALTNVVPGAATATATGADDVNAATLGGSSRAVSGSADEVPLAGATDPAQTDAETVIAVRDAAPTQGHLFDADAGIAPGHAAGAPSDRHVHND